MLTEFTIKQEHLVENISTKYIDTRSHLKFPKFDLEKFNVKNPFEWTSFIDLFNEAMNVNSSLSGVEK